MALVWLGRTIPRTASQFTSKRTTQRTCRLALSPSHDLLLDFQVAAKLPVRLISVLFYNIFLCSKIVDYYFVEIYKYVCT